MDFKLDKTLGYMYCYQPDHFCANKAGKVYQHILVMVEHIGRPLYENECVHHIDRIRSNNELSNLLLLTRSEHALLHALEDRAVQKIERKCKNCGISFSATTRLFCSTECYHNSNVRFYITADELRWLVWSMPSTKVANLLGVSDTAIKKRCRKLGIDKPPRGYWSAKNNKMT